MSSTAITILVIAALGVGAYFAWTNRCSWFNICGADSGNIPQDLIDTVKAIGAGGLSSISGEHDIASEITKQGIQHSVKSDPTSKLGAGPYTTGTGKNGGMSLVPVSQAPKIGTGIPHAQGTNTNNPCPAGQQLNAGNRCEPAPVGFARSMLGTSVSGYRMSLN